MLKVGDNHWYGKSVPRNITFAAEMYAEAASKNDLPQVTFVSFRNATGNVPILTGHSET